MIETNESALEAEEKTIIRIIRGTESPIVRGHRKHVKRQVNVNAHPRKICLSKLLTGPLHNAPCQKGQSATKSFSFHEHFCLRSSHSGIAHEEHHLAFPWARSAHIEPEHTAGRVTTFVHSSSGMPLSLAMQIAGRK